MTHSHRPAPNGAGGEPTDRRLPIFLRQGKFQFGISHAHRSSFATSARSWCVGGSWRLLERAPRGRYEKPRTHPLSIYRWRMFSVHFCVLRAAALFASGKARHVIGIWSMVRVGWRRSPGAIRSPWPGPSRWPIASLFMRTTLTAASAAPGSWPSLAVFMAGGSPQN